MKIIRTLRFRATTPFGLISSIKNPTGKTGWLVIDKPPCRVLVMRSDLSDEEKESRVNGFLGTRSFAIERSNVGDTKPYGDAYKEFLASIRVSPEYAQRMLQSNYAKHFFRADELEALYSHWTRP
jgi:hypothetical protein